MCRCDRRLLSLVHGQLALAFGDCKRESLSNKTLYSTAAKAIFKTAVSAVVFNDWAMFYSQDSSFVHGGPEKQECAMGQHDIHQRIMQLNFRDCHAKIKQVDSLTTLGEGVVIQVTGELSNAGQPMRRFMQTFVLAPQQPLKYYVRNDIFRYQDEVFTEEEEEEEGNTAAEQAQEEVSEPLMAHHQAAHSEVVQHTADATTALVNEAPVPPRGEQLGNGGSSPPSNSVAQTPGRPAYFDSQQVMRNGTAHLVPEVEISSQASLTSGSPPEAPSSAPTVATTNSMNWKDDESPAPPTAPQVNHQEFTAERAETSGSAIEACDEDESPDEEIAVTWADLQEGDVPASVYLNEFLQADSLTW
ncbi:hypothetical protein HPB51_005968 [Rhipicephalus microplus]|uniref:NTF2 domain-containing protein n=1 Tax=Rhipicephalus microplus TaxID=6941 RepID=A0A9J6EGB3_RHIMP|nr:hypothetical protein HPB51_005968 [Rhipicephalus microplus]